MSKVIRLDTETMKILKDIREIHIKANKTQPEYKHIFEKCSDSKLIKILLYQVIQNMKGE